MSTPQDDLRFLRSMIDSSRRAARVDTMPLLVWGMLTVIGVIAVYLLPALDSAWFWLGVIGLAWAYSLYRHLQIRRQSGVVLFSHRALYVLWLALLTAMTLIGFVGYASGRLPGAAITPVFSILFGVGYLAASVLMERRGLVFLALAWWGVGLGLFFTPPALLLAVFGAAILALVVVPAGLLLRAGPQR